MSLKKWFLFIFIFIAIIFLIIHYYIEAIHDDVYYMDIDMEPDEHTRIILVWTWPFGVKLSLHNCPASINMTGCVYTDNRKWFSSAVAVVLHHSGICYSKYLLPRKPRPPNQYWIWFNMESPSNSPNLHFMDNLMNLTMTYRSDSDIYTPYGRLEQTKEEETFTIPPKSKLVAWIISKWNPQSRRVLYYEELRKFLSIDVFGNKEWQKSLPVNEQQQTLSKYKFYLAFENSIHEDYITEKLWRNSLTSGLVPIILGASRKNYERFIPKDSFIHVDDFPSAQDLAAYILKLDSDDKAYQQYFSWRSRFRPLADFDWKFSYCKVCQALKEAPKHKTISRLGDWYK